MKLEPVIGDDPRDILRALKSALHGAGPALGLGLVSTLPGEVPPGPPSSSRHPDRRVCPRASSSAATP